MLWWQSVEHAVENEFRQEQLIPGTDLTGNPALHINNV